MAMHNVVVVPKADRGSEAIAKDCKKRLNPCPVNHSANRFTTQLYSQVSSFGERETIVTTLHIARLPTQ